MLDGFRIPAAVGEILGIAFIAIGITSGVASRTELERRVDARTVARPDWPGNPRRLSGQLRRLAPDLRSRGIDMHFDERESHTRRRLIVMSKVV